MERTPSPFVILINKADSDPSALQLGSDGIAEALRDELYESFMERKESPLMVARERVLACFNEECAPSKTARLARDAGIADTPACREWLVSQLRTSFSGHRKFWERIELELSLHDFHRAFATESKGDAKTERKAESKGDVKREIKGY